MRSTELLISRDQVNLQQGMHSAVHIVAQNLRSQASTYEQYLAYKETRQAARQNLEKQFAEYRSGRVNFILVVQAIGNWGDAVSAEARALTAYNSALAGLETETGTILETHGIAFMEERFGSLGPGAVLGNRLCAPQQCYPRAETPTLNADRYPDDGEPAEDSFDLNTPADLLQDPSASDEPPPLPLPPQ
jgi:hypothetical protein